MPLLYVNTNTFVIVVITNVFEFTRPITHVNTFGNRLRHARKLRKLTQAQLARACGLSQGAIGNYEADSRRSAKDVFRIAEALDVDPAWLAMGAGSMERPDIPRVTEHGALAMAPAPWPFPGVDPAHVWALSPEQRQILASALAGMMAAMHDPGADSRG